PPPGGDEAAGRKPPPDKNGNPVQPGDRRPTLALSGQLVELDVDGDGLLSEVVVARVQDPADEVLGATLQPAGDALRAQLAPPPGQGLLVAAMRADGPSAQAGLKQNDLLVALADKPLASADDLTKHLKAAGEATVPLKVLRAGRVVTLQVRPVYRVTLGP